jgi:DNA-binding response OmpR family regulator
MTPDSDSDSDSQPGPPSTEAPPSERLPILVIEDEASIREGVCDVLAFRHYVPTGVGDGEEGLSQALSGNYALAIVDVMLPGLNGFEICSRIRAQHVELPILMLTAKGAEEDILQGFESGADDYVTKPFSVRELLARVQALLKRSGKLSNDTFQFGPWEVDAARLCGRAGDDEIQLTPRELALMRVLRRERGRIVSRRLLLREVWGFQNADQLETRTVDVHIAKLRKKTARDRITVIETVRGAGYRLQG